MLRLFLSLYLAICLGLVAISFTSNQLFQHLQFDSEINKQTDIEVVAQLAQSFVGLNKSTLSQLLTKLPFSNQVIPINQLQLLPEQTSQLNGGRALILYESDNIVAVYVKLNGSELLHINGIELSNTSAHSSLLQQVVIVISYMSLALFVLAWSRPLWRDLSRIKHASEHIQCGEFSHVRDEVNVKKSSVIYPVVKSFKVMAQKIEELLSNQKQMTHAISHDIRTPLARIKFSLAILQKQPELLEKNSQDMLEDVAEIDRLTSELLTFAKLEHQQTLNKENVDIQQMLQHLAEKLQRNSDIQLNVNCSENTWLNCDGHLIERALQNVITNGFKYAKSVVEVTVTKHAQQLIIEVHDDGIGIKPEFRESVLNPFATADNSRNKSTSGFGLGLAIVNKIITWHQGGLQIKTSDLGGVLVEITLPNR